MSNTLPPVTDERLDVLPSEALAQQISDLLALLGDSKEDVAARLDALGIKGQRMSASACPVANYLREHGVCTPVVSGSQVGALGEAIVELPVPRHIGDFVTSFDVGNYPQLIDEQSKAV